MPRISADDADKSGFLGYKLEAGKSKYNDSLKYRELTDKIIGVFYEVYNELGFGFLESVYENALVIAFKAKGLKVEQQVPTPVWFRGQKVGDFIADLIIEGIV